MCNALTTRNNLIHDLWQDTQFQMALTRNVSRSQFNGTIFTAKLFNKNIGHRARLGENKTKTTTGNPLSLIRAVT